MRPGARLNATTLAAETGIPLPTAQKLIGRLAAAGLLESARGTGGGFRLARPPAAISLADIVEAVEGPIVDDQLRRRRAPRMRARKRLPGPPAHGRGQRRGARRARRASASSSLAEVKA